MAEGRGEPLEETAIVILREYADMDGGATETELPDAILKYWMDQQVLG